jgi:2-haloacid dehalogenase
VYTPFSEITRDTLLHALAEKELQLDEGQVDDLMDAYNALSIFPDVKPALEKLAASPNLECVIFSNGTHSMVSSSVQQSNDLSPHSSLFKDIVTVDHIKRFKPAPEVYKHLIEKTGRLGHEKDVWLVSGNPFDIVGARTFGIQAAWLDRAGKGWQDRQGGRPTLIVQSLEELHDAIQAHSA